MSRKPPRCKTRPAWTTGPRGEPVGWSLNRQWLDLLARSGTPLFVSADPDAITGNVRTGCEIVLHPVSWVVVRGNGSVVQELEGQSYVEVASGPVVSVTRPCPVTLTL